MVNVGIGPALYGEEFVKGDLFSRVGTVTVLFLPEPVLFKLAVAGPVGEPVFKLIPEDLLLTVVLVVSLLDGLTHFNGLCKFLRKLDLDPFRRTIFPYDLVYYLAGLRDRAEDHGIAHFSLIGNRQQYTAV